MDKATKSVFCLTNTAILSKKKDNYIAQKKKMIKKEEKEIYTVKNQPFFSLSVFMKLPK